MSTTDGNAPAGQVNLDRETPVEIPPQNVAQQPEPVIPEPPEPKEIITDSPMAVSVETVQRWITDGYYDGQFDQLEVAMDTRRAHRQAEVREQVREVFGAEYDVKLVIAGVADDVPKAAEQKPNPFVQRAQEKSEQEKLPGPYRIDPVNGNSLRASGPVDDEGFLTITDIFGGHESRVLKDIWVSWEQVVDDNDDQGDALSNTQSELEAQMIAEGAAGEVPIESRGAIIGGLSSSQIGD